MWLILIIIVVLVIWYLSKNNKSYNIVEEFPTKLSGVTHKNEDGTSRQNLLKNCKEGEKLILKPDPDNEYSDTAVKVLKQDGTQLGWLRKRTSKEMFKWLTEEKPGYKKDYECKIKNITGGGDKNIGCNISIKKIKVKESPDSSKNNWYQKTGWIVTFLILFFPLGLFLMWKYKKFSKASRIIISIFFAIVIIGNIDSDENTKNKTAEHITENVLSETKDTTQLVKKIQGRLSKLGYNITVDGIYGDNTQNTIKQFQNNNNLDTSGIVGRNTYNKLFQKIKNDSPNTMLNNYTVEERKKIFRELVRAEYRATDEAEEKYPVMNVSPEKSKDYNWDKMTEKNAELSRKLENKYVNQILEKYKLSKEDRKKINKEALDKKWEFPKP